MTINLNNYSFEEWIRFVFDHPVSEAQWYFSDCWSWSDEPEHSIKYIVQLFKNPVFLLEQYSPKQIEQGFWFLLSPVGRVSDWLWDQEIPWALRQECILSMVDVFEKLFTKNPLGETCYMWWDLLRNFEDNPDRRVNEVAFRALSEILNLNSRDCQVSAIHGLGHSSHFQKEEVIREFLEKNPNLDEQLKSYALAALQGKLQ